MENETDVKNRIIAETRERLFKFGYSKVTMDEVADSVGISKKTIYKYFDSKNDLIMSVLLTLMQEISGKISKIFNDDQITYLAKLQQLMGVIGNYASQINSVKALDLQRNAPEIWSEIERIREKVIMDNFRLLMQEGIEQGIIRDDVNQDLVILMVINCVQTIIIPRVLSELPLTMKELFDSMVRVFFNGILVKGYEI